MADESGESDAATGGVSDRDDESADVKTYECDNCGHRVRAEHQPGTCPVCGGELVDISVSRE